MAAKSFLLAVFTELQCSAVPKSQQAQVCIDQSIHYISTGHQTNVRFTPAVYKYLLQHECVLDDLKIEDPSLHQYVCQHSTVAMVTTFAAVVLMPDFERSYCRVLSEHIWPCVYSQGQNNSQTLILVTVES